MYSGQGAAAFTQGMMSGYKFMDDMKSSKQDRDIKQQQMQLQADQTKSQLITQGLAQDSQAMKNDATQRLIEAEVNKATKEMGGKIAKIEGRSFVDHTNAYLSTEGSEDFKAFKNSIDEGMQQKLGINNMDTARPLISDSSYDMEKVAKEFKVDTKTSKALMDSGLLIEVDGKITDLSEVVALSGGREKMTQEQASAFDGKLAMANEAMFEFTKQKEIAQVKADSEYTAGQQNLDERIAGIAPKAEKTPTDTRSKYGKFVDDFMVRNGGTIEEANDAWNAENKTSSAPGSLEKTYDFLLTQNYSEEDAMNIARSMAGRSPVAQALLLKDMIDKEQDPDKKVSLETLYTKVNTTGSNASEDIKEKEEQKRMNVVSKLTAEDFTAANKKTGDVSVDVKNEELLALGRKMEAEKKFTAGQDKDMQKFKESARLTREFQETAKHMEALVASGKYKSGVLDDSAKFMVGMLPKSLVDFVDPENKWYDSMLVDKRLDRQLVEYVKSVSGLAVTDREFVRLKEILQGTFPSEEARLDSLKEFHASLRKNLDYHADSLIKTGYTGSVPMELNLLDEYISDSKLDGASRPKEEAPIDIPTSDIVTDRPAPKDGYVILRKTVNGVTTYKQVKE